MGKFGTFVGGALAASALWMGIPSNSETVAVRDQAAAINARAGEIGTSETITRKTDDHKKSTFAIKGKEVIEIAEQRKELNYDEMGIPTSERIPGNLLWALGLWFASTAFTIVGATGKEND